MMKTFRIYLNTFGRLTISTRLPETGDRSTGVIVQDIRKKLDFAQAEIEALKLEVQQLDGGKVSYKWNQKEDKEHLYIFTELEFKIVRAIFDKLEEKKELPTLQEWGDLYDRMIGAKPFDEASPAEKV